MQDGQWRLFYAASGSRPGDDLTFGTGDTGYLLLKEPAISYGQAEYGDQPIPGEDGIRMGVDTVTNMTLRFSIGVDTVDRPLPGLRSSTYTGPGKQGLWNMDAVSRFKALWHADASRTSHRTWAVLMTRRAGGRVSQVIGRPRTCEPAQSRLYRQGYTPLVADFVTVDDRFYDAVVKSLDITQRIGGPSGAWTGIPQSTKLPAVGTLQVGGNLPAWPVITLSGPMTDPEVWLGNAYLKFSGLTLSASDWIVVDTRPWRRTVYRKDGSSVAHLLSSNSSRLAEVLLAPGGRSFSASWGGAAISSGMARCEWQDAYAWM